MDNFPQSFRLLSGFALLCLLAACGGSSNDTPQVTDDDPPPAQVPGEFGHLALYPDQGASDIALDSDIWVDFEIPLTPTTHDGDWVVLTRTSDGTLISGRTSLAEEGTRLLFSTTGLLEPDSDYQVTVLAGLLNTQDEQLDAPIEWTFRTETLLAHGHVQDLWVFERIVRVGRTNPTADITETLAEALQAHAQGLSPIELTGGVHFTPLNELLRPRLSRRVAETGESETRTDVSLQAGLLQYADAYALAILATPDPGADEGISFDDELLFDLTFLGDDIVAVGDALFFDYAFGQATPSATDDLDKSAIALFQGRLAREQFQYYGLERLGEPEVLLYENQLGVARAGSTMGGLPAKSSDMTNGMARGLRGCGFGLKCVSNFFRRFGAGATSSFDQALDNRHPRNRPPNYIPPELRNNNDRRENRRRERRRPLCLGRRCGTNNGDPHLTTFDGIYYDMMAVGEFTLARNDIMEVQIRTAPWNDLPAASAAIAAAVRLGDVELAFYQQAPFTEQIRLHGEPVNMLTLMAYPMTVGDVEISLVGSTLQIVGHDHQVSIVNHAYQRYLNVYIDLPDGPLAELPTTRGLLGQVSDNPGDDFITRDGRLLDQPVNTETLYDDFIHSWRITDDTSLFYYRSGESTATFTDLAYPENPRTVADLTPEEYAYAEAICAAAGVTEEQDLINCIFDVGFTGEPAFATDARATQLAGMIRRGEISPDDIVAGGQMLLTEPVDVDWVALASTVASTLDNPDILTVSCPPMPEDFRFYNRRVWGSGLYTANSNICLAGAHAGVVDFEQGGVFAVRFIPGTETEGADTLKVGSTANGVWSSPFTALERVFDVIAYDSYRGCNAGLSAEAQVIPAGAHSFIDDALIEELAELGTSFYKGNQPPQLSGTFAAEHLQVIHDDDGRPVGYDDIITYWFTFDDQDEDGTISYSYSTPSPDNDDAGTADRAFISGNGQCFTVYAEFTDQQPGCTRTAIEVTSGRMHEGAIVGLENTIQYYRHFEGSSCDDQPGVRTVNRNHMQMAVPVP